MAVLAWVGAPLLAGAFDSPSAWPRAIVLSLTVGLVWQFVLVLLLVHREQGSLRWPVIKRALWLRPPQSPRTGRRGGWLWLLLIPLILAVAAKEQLPKLPAPVNRVGQTHPGIDTTNLEVAATVRRIKAAIPDIYVAWPGETHHLPPTTRGRGPG
jgi:hypothetical protein